MRTSIAKASGSISNRMSPFDTRWPGATRISTYNTVYLRHDLDPQARHDNAVELLFKDVRSEHGAGNQ